MRDNLKGAAWRLVVFVTVSLFGAFTLIVIFGQLRFDRGTTFNALFSNVSGLEKGNFVRIAGVEVGKVSEVTINDDTTVNVTFRVEDSVVLTEGTRAVIRYDNLIGGRYLALEEAPGGSRKLDGGQTIPLSRTSPALDLDALIGGFRPLFRALDPGQVNALSTQLISAFQGQGATIGSFLDQTAALTNTLADKDQLIGQVIGNLNIVLGSLGDQSSQFAKGVESLSELVATLADRKGDLANAVSYGNSAAGSIADLLTQARPPLSTVIDENDRASGIVVADHEYLDDFLKTLPHAYQILSRQGMYGDFFSFYLCDIVLKVNGKGGQPVYIKLAGQPTGRCTPR
ncbi:virulence factor Mce family protein [Mycolicibacterium alvei]|uniref:Mce family protein Mce3B n=1 Tax=Mycolicibacterium alvei TaxID=67081 RepID=A0A6N4UWB6_9MYCO|nr:virulence factor Mce family protein [Mycolicibacterium alvei]MCV7003943.1 virulence factor Mce family protein [Mycolicibacterium alvei]BBX27702.1 Mce family protein Mce3B [Mycolicibacterium alvei]